MPSTPVAPTTDLSLPVIAFGTQPATQLSLDYPMHENCERRSPFFVYDKEMYLFHAARIRQ